MKRITILLSVFALVAGLSQCRKPSFSALNGGGEPQHVVLSANNGNDGSKVSVSLGKTMDLTWDQGDVITVSGGLKGTLTLVKGDGGPTATFEGYPTKGTGDVVFTYGGTPVFMGQTGTQDCVKKNICLEGKDMYKADGNYNVLMEVPYAVLKLDLSALGTATGTTVTIKVVGGDPVASVEGVTKTSTEVYVAVPAPNAFDTPSGSLVSKQYEFESSVGIARCNGWKLVKNTFYTLTGGTGAAIVVVPACKFIDLGLPSGTLWADRNVGAEDENAAGWLFSWGNITGYVWTGSEWVEASDNTKPFSGFTSTNYTGTPGKSLNEDIPVNAAYDAALLYCGGDCRIPTRIEYQELLDNADWAWDNEKNGYIISEKNNPDNKIFLYAAGNGKNDGTYSPPGIGHYWTSTYYSTNFSYDLRIASGGTKLSADYERNHGFTIRAVKPATAE